MVQHLLEQGWRVRALTRKPESKKAKKLKAMGADVVKANLEDKASLEAAFENMRRYLKPGGVKPDVPWWRLWDPQW